MSNIFLISDTHFGHENACKVFKLADGCTPLRPFSCAAECDEAMIERWNAVVKPTDKVYHLGDIAMADKHVHTLGRLNGIKVLIKGNHDEGKMSLYMQYFKDVRGSHQLDRFVLTHIPVHPGSLSRWTANIHGHLHANRVQLAAPFLTMIDDPRYFCASVEQIDFTPIALEDVKVIINHNLEKYSHYL